MSETNIFSVLNDRACKNCEHVNQLLKVTQEFIACNQIFAEQEAGSDAEVGEIIINCHQDPDNSCRLAIGSAVTWSGSWGDYFSPAETLSGLVCPLKSKK